MAALTWRNVEGPNFDMRSMFQATQGLDTTFGRFGDILNQREEKLRTDATDAALAQGYAAQDPEAVAALMAKGVGGMGPRVNGRAFMEAMAKYKSDLVDSGYKNEQRLTLKDDADNASTYASLLSAGGMGDRAALANFGSQQGLRNLARYMERGVQFAGDHDIRAEDVRYHDVQDANQDADRARQSAADKMSHSAAMANLALGRERLNYERNRDSKIEQRQLQGEVAERAGRGFIMDKRINGYATLEDTMAILRKDAGFQKLNSTQQEAMERGAASAWEARFTPTSVDNAKIVPGTGETVGAYNQRMAKSNTAAVVTLEKIREKNYRDNPALKAYIETVESNKNKDKNWDSLYKDAKDSGMYFSAKTVDRLKSMGISPAEAANIREAYGIRPKSWYEWSSQSSGARPGEDATSMGDQWVRAAEDYKTRRDTPQFMDQRQALKNDLDPIRNDILTSIAVANRNSRAAATEDGPSMTDAIIQANLKRSIDKANAAARNGSKWMEVSGKSKK